MPKLDIPLQENAVDVDEILREYDAYIIALARKELPHIVMHTELLEDDIDEIAQMTRVKLNAALRKGPINNLAAYIRSIVRSQRIDFLRKHKYSLPLILDAEGEIQQGKVLFPGAPRFNEFVVESKEEPYAINSRLLGHKIIGGLPLKKFYPELGNAALWCCTELTTRGAIDTAVGVVAERATEPRRSKEETGVGGVAR